MKELKQTWIDSYLGRFKCYRKLKKGTWYKRSFNENAYQLRLKSYSNYWTRYGGKSSYCEVIEIENL
jgi:hypothetical protein